MIVAVNVMFMKMFAVELILQNTLSNTLWKCRQNYINHKISTENSQPGILRHKLKISTTRKYFKIHTPLTPPCSMNFSSARREVGRKQVPEAGVNEGWKMKILRREYIYY